MIDRFTARLASRFLSFGLPYLYLLTSIAFYLHTYDSAQVKITIVQMLGTVLVSFFYVQLLCDDDKRWKSYLPLAVPLLVSLASGVFSYTHAAYRGPSLDECVRRIFYIHFALIALRGVNTLERLKRLTTYLIAAVAVATVYGFVQIVDEKFFRLPADGIDPFVWRQAFSYRIFSTFGNPNFFGNFLVILTPITLALLLKRNAERPAAVMGFAVLSLLVATILWKSMDIVTLFHGESYHPIFFWGILLPYCLFAVLRFSFLGALLFLITLCNMCTESKGAWIGYAAGFVSFLVLVLFHFSQFRSENLKRVAIRAASVTVLVYAVWVGVYSHSRTDSLRFRICTWVSTWEMAQIHPIWGNGIGSFRILYPAYRRPQIFHIEGKHNTETDHSEDEYWEVLQDEGLVGFGIFIWVILTFSFVGVRALSRFTEAVSIRDPTTGKKKISYDPRAFYMLGYLSAFWAMLIHNMMDVSLRFVSSGVFLWLIAGVIGALSMHQPLRETDEARLAAEDDETPSSPAHPMPLLVAARIVSLALFGAFIVMMLGQFNDVQGTFPDPFGEQFLWLISWAAMLGTVGAVVWAIYLLTRSMRQVWGFAILWAMVPFLNVFWGYFMADAYHNRGIFYSKSANWDAALDAYHKVVTLNPNYIMAYYFMGNVYTDRWHPGDLENAMAEYKKVWALAPNYVQSHHQAGLVYLKRGQEERQQFDQLRGQHQDAQAMDALLSAQRDWETAVSYFEKYHDIDPVFEPNYSRLGWVHTQLADIDKILGKPAEAERHYDAAEAAYKESLGAWVCDSPGNDVLHEHWWQSHRHFSSEMFGNLGDVRFLRGDLQGSARAYQLSLWQDPKNTRTLKNLASVYNRLGRQSDVIRMWNEVRMIAPTDPDLQRVFHVNPATPRTP